MLPCFLTSFYIVTSAFAQAPQSDGKATVYLYRESDAVVLRKLPIFVDEIQFADLTQNKYLRVRLDPGKHTLRGGTKKKIIRVQLEAGRTSIFGAKVRRRAGAQSGRSVKSPLKTANR